MAYSSHSCGYDSGIVNPVGIDYLIRNEKAREDHTNKIPDKTMAMERLPWGFFGYTYLGQGKAWLNERLNETPEFKKEVDLHEVIHTNDEYETRVLSRDMLKFQPDKEIVKRLMKDLYYVSLKI